MFTLTQNHLIQGGVVAAVVLWGSVAPGAAAADVPVPKIAAWAKQREEPKEVQLRGRVICIAELLRDRYGANLPANHEHLYGIQTAEGNIYTLLRSKLSEALFVDTVLQKKELVLKGRLFPRTQVFESTSMRSVRNGLLNELYYYCDVCDIQMVTPGNCECCQGPVKLVEKPLQKQP